MQYKKIIKYRVYAPKKRPHVELICTLFRKYKELGYNGLVNKQKGRKNPGMKKKTIEI